jgi:CHAT domain-containing protein
VAAALNKMAQIEAALGKYVAAAGRYERILEIYENTFGADHAEYGRALDGLAGARLAMGRVDEARTLFERALIIQERTLDPDHPSVARTLENLAYLDREAGRLADALTSLERALKIREAALGPDHPLVAATLGQLGEVQARRGESADALRLALRAEMLGREHLRLTMRTLAERQALHYAAVRSSGLDLILSLAAGGLDPESVGQAWDALCQSRALVLDEMVLRRGTFVSEGQSSTPGLEEQLAAASRRLANLTLRGPRKLPPERYRELLVEARREKEMTEVALAEASAAFRQERQRTQIGLDQVAAALPRDTALVAFALYRNAYLAFVLDAKRSEAVAVPLGSAAEIDDLVSAWREEATLGHFKASRTPGEAERVYRQVGVALRQKIWDPLAMRLAGAKQVFIVPDATLHLVSFPALPVGRSRYLIEKRPVIHLLTAERDVVAYGTPTTHGEGLLALGGPAFNDVPTFGGRAGEGGISESAMRSFSGSRSSCGDLGTDSFTSLPSATREVEAIAALWDSSGGQRAGKRSAVHLTGADASEASFKQLAPGRRVLHLATHGFFLGERCPSLLDATRGIGALVTADGDEPAFPLAAENPLLLSGLALAGANRRDAAEVDEEDGILTAEEIAAMDLLGVEWAVLSACDTGVGKVQVGEGVLGMRRAFQVAGTGTVIMSLWSVADWATDLWMRALYEARLTKNLGTSEAVREAGLASLRRQRKDDQTTHPFYWGAFVAAGDWR